MRNWDWEYDEKELSKTEYGTILLLEHQINYSPAKGDKIKLSQVKKYWDKLHLFTDKKQLMELLIWGKIKTPTDKNVIKHKLPKNLTGLLYMS